MKIDQLIYFLETAKTQHIGKASRILNVSPSAISHSISALEEELGRPLFEKVGKSISLTVHGKKFSEKLEPILGALDKAKEDIQAEDVEPEGHVKVAATHGLCDKYLMPRLNVFQREYPKLSFEVYSLRSAQVVEGVSAGLFDLGLCFSPLNSPKLIRQKIRSEPLVIAVSPKNPILKFPKSKWVMELKKLPCASPRSFQGIEVCEDHPALKKIGIQLQPQFIFDSYDTAAQKILGSHYWCLLPKFFSDVYKLADITPDGFDADAIITAISPKNRPLGKHLQKWVDSWE